MLDFDRDKYHNTMLSDHFRRYEFACKGCRDKQSCPYGHNYGAGLAQVDAGLLNVIEDARKHFGKPITITSGHRCEQHNRSQGGTKRSQHLIGNAVDITVRDRSPAVVYIYFNLFWRGGLGRYRNFTHIDIRGKKVRF